MGKITVMCFRGDTAVLQNLGPELLFTGAIVSTIAALAKFTECAWDWLSQEGNI
jgi:hypothetical protein